MALSTGNPVHSKQWAPESEQKISTRSHRKPEDVTVYGSLLGNKDIKLHSFFLSIISTWFIHLNVLSFPRYIIICIVFKPQTPHFCLLKKLPVFHDGTTPLTCRGTAWFHLNYHFLVKKRNNNHKNLSFSLALLILYYYSFCSSFSVKHWKGAAEQIAFL